ncbi:slr1306 family protein [Aphanothece sacrum]|uniref:GTP-binding protein n=1 Tax=Aphanothece sacrum FPU1 TaxID=1920663 RepID=A0A401IJ62_APHSA|nr:DUF697 domain-containing protein [Aphanothece sacrum]GBF81328.1 GTP-binding protein [Aphanothece sacrum FPU1]GBF86149.1 GTP-binding protein [Aphanothece sacrum FPU3]
MTVKVNKPILVAGIGISFLLWIGESLQEKFLQLGEWGLLGAMTLGTGFWWWQRQTKALPTVLSVSPLTLEMVKDAIAQTQKVINYFQEEAPNQDISDLNEQLDQVSQTFERQNLSIAVVGGKNTGKTTLKQLLVQENIAKQVNWIDTEPLFTEVENTSINADLLLFLTNGDLTDSQWQYLQERHRNYQRSLLIFNKQDNYSQEERALILQMLRQRVESIIPSEDIIPISAAPRDIMVRQHRDDGTIQEWKEKQTSDVQQLQGRLQEIIKQERKGLVWGSIWRESTEIKQKAQERLNQVRRDRALPIIEQYQWIAAATAFANPVAALDLLATAAISSQMVVDLSGIYQQKFSLSQGQTASGTIGKLMMQLGLVEMSTQAIAGLLKSNMITYIAGGATQGISAAYLTRVAGLSLIEYFQVQDINSETQNGINFEQFSQKLKQVFENNQRMALLQNFVKQTVPHLSTLSPS